MEIKGISHTQQLSLKPKSSLISPLDLNLNLRTQNVFSCKYTNHTSLMPKNINLKLHNNHSFSQNKIKKRRNSIQINLFRPNSANEYKNSIKHHINMKNINLIKQNLKNLENKYLTPGNSKRKIKLYHNSSLNNNSSHSNQQKSNSRLKKITQSPQEVFLFQKHNSLKSKNFNHRFDRSKYFNTSTLKNLVDSKINLQNFYKTQNKPILKNQSKVQQKYVFFDEIIPVIKKRNSKPKTTGGFLKKYSAQPILFMQDLFKQKQEQQIFQ